MSAALVSKFGSSLTMQLKRITDTADEARALLASMDPEELTGKDSMPKDGGHITRTFTKAKA
jgi:hypothetical protein